MARFSFGLVSVPVKMYSAIDEADLHFHLIHEPDNGRIGYQKICKREEEPVPDEEIVKAFEYAKGKHVVLTDEDFEAAKSEGVKSSSILDFVPYDEIDPFRAHLLPRPAGGREKVYSPCVRRWSATELAAIGKYVMRERQHLGCLRVHDGDDHARAPVLPRRDPPREGTAPRRSQASKAEPELATTLIERISGSGTPSATTTTIARRCSRS